MSNVPLAKAARADAGSEVMVVSCAAFVSFQGHNFQRALRGPHIEMRLRGQNCHFQKPNFPQHMKTEVGLKEALHRLESGMLLFPT